MLADEKVPQKGDPGSWLLYIYIYRFIAALLIHIIVFGMQLFFAICKMLNNLGKIAVKLYNHKVQKNL